MAEDMSDEEATKILQAIGATQAVDEKHNVHTFLRNVAIAEDTTKVGNLRDDNDLNELGLPKHPVRTYKELALFCREVANMGYFSDYFNKKAEIITSTSLSREAKLINLSVLHKKEIADVTKRTIRKKKGWFRKPEERQIEGQLTTPGQQ